MRVVEGDDFPFSVPALNNGESVSYTTRSSSVLYQIICIDQRVTAVVVGCSVGVSRGYMPLYNYTIRTPATRDYSHIRSLVHVLWLPSPFIFACNYRWFGLRLVCPSDKEWPLVLAIEYAITYPVP